MWKEDSSFGYGVLGNAVLGFLLKSSEPSNVVSLWFM